LAEQRWPAPSRHVADWDAEITEVIPFNEFGALAELGHPEHGYNGIAPGSYEIRRQREMAEEIRMVQD